MSTLQAIASFGKDNRLIPLTISKNGISLLQCFSRALVGREIFWHPLGELLKEHFKMYENFYLENLNAFNITEEEWTEVLNEYDKCTNEQSSEQSNENGKLKCFIHILFEFYLLKLFLLFKLKLFEYSHSPIFCVDQ